MVAIRTDRDKRGVPVEALPRLESRPTAFITTDPAAIPGSEIPVLIVDNLSDAVLRLGGYSRSHMTGRLIAVTGSAGKTTTVAMIHHVLASFGSVAQTRNNANLPYGVAWNLASTPWDVTTAVLELAIGGMEINSRMSRPDVAVVTNVLPAHLVYHNDVSTIARRKSRIFHGMSPGGYAVLNNEMIELDIFVDAARDANLNIIYYGTSPTCQFQLLDYDVAESGVTASCFGEPIRYVLSAPGRHMALNSLAVLAALAALGYDVSSACSSFATFQPLHGRGAVIDVSVRQADVTIVDDAYNANPGSMEAAVDQFGKKYSTRRTLLCLGEMLELGEEAETYHTQLASAVSTSGIDRVYAAGQLYSDFWMSLPNSMRGALVNDPAELKLILRDTIEDGDALLIKGSHGSKIHTLVDWLKDGAAPLNTNIGALTYDIETDRVLYAQNENTRYAPGALTKLLTLCLIDERLAEVDERRDADIVISETAGSIGSRWGFDPGDRVSLGDLMAAVMVVNSNEAADALAEWHSGSREAFTAQLNRKAVELGLDSTQFSSPSGLGGNQWITPLEALALCRFVLKRHPEVAALAKAPSFSWKNKSGTNTNYFVNDFADVDGLKMGRLGRFSNLIMTTTPPRGRIIVVLGAGSKPELDDAALWLRELPD